MKKPARPESSCCAPLLAGRLGKADAATLAQAFKAIADPVRLRLLSFLAAQPAAETCVCFLTGPLGLTQPTVSHHLKVLHDAGLVDRERRGTWIHYRIVPQRLAELRAVLAPSGKAPRKAAAAPDTVAGRKKASVPRSRKPASRTTAQA